jgi:hypothetical protein
MEGFIQDELEEVGDAKLVNNTDGELIVYEVILIEAPPGYLPVEYALFRFHFICDGDMLTYTKNFTTLEEMMNEYHAQLDSGFIHVKNRNHIKNDSVKQLIYETTEKFQLRYQ